MTPDLEKSAWLYQDDHWTEATEPPDGPRIEGRFEGRGCDTGCVGYRFYFEPEDGVIGFVYIDQEAVDLAMELSARYHRPVFLERNTDGW